MRKAYKSIDEFYDERGGRFSGENDFGVHWRDGGSVRYRVSAVHETGDVYATSGSLTLLLGTVPTHDRGLTHNPEFGGACRGGCAYTEAERRLDGWADFITDERSILIAAERL